MKYLVFIMIWFLTNSYGQSIKENVGNSLAERFPGKIIEFENFLIPEEIKSEIEIKAKQRFFRNELYLWKIFSSDTLISIAFVDNVYGKELPITFLVIFDELGSVTQADIVKYRSTRGGDVQKKSWLNQFIGFNNESLFEVGNTIDGISGASFSTKSVTKGIYKLTLLAQYLLFE